MQRYLPVADPKIDLRAEIKLANRRLLRILVLVSIGMFGFGFALWPLYTIFCEATGFGGRGVQEVAAEDLKQYQNQREITIRFDATVNSGLNWKFKPVQTSKTVKLGEISQTSYTAANLADQAVIGHAVFNVAPPEASLYFVKTECFCFTEQLLEEGERKEMPVTFYISPDLPDDIGNITLSYTFFENVPATLALNEKLATDKLNDLNTNTLTTNDT